MVKSEWVPGKPTEPGVYWFTLKGQGGDLVLDLGRVTDGFAPEFASMTPEELMALSEEDSAKAHEPYLYVRFLYSGIHTTLSSAWVVEHQRIPHPDRKP